MKYPNWNEYDNAKKWKAVADEVKLETNNGTTKADLLNMVKFLAHESVTLQAQVYDLEIKLEIHDIALKSACKELENTQLNWLTTGGNSLEFTFLRKAQMEVTNK